MAEFYSRDFLSPQILVMSSPPRVHSVSGDLKEGKFKSFYTSEN